MRNFLLAAVALTGLGFAGAAQAGGPSPGCNCVQASSTAGGAAAAGTMGQGAGVVSGAAAIGSSGSYAINTWGGRSAGSSTNNGAVAGGKAYIGAYDTMATSSSFSSSFVR